MEGREGAVWVEGWVEWAVMAGTGWAAGEEVG